MSSGPGTPDGSDKDQGKARGSADEKPAKGKRRRRSTLNDWPTIELTPPARASRDVPVAGEPEKGIRPAISLNLPLKDPESGAKPGRGAVPKAATGGMANTPGLFSTKGRPGLPLPGDDDATGERRFSTGSTEQQSASPKRSRAPSVVPGEGLGIGMSPGLDDNWGLDDEAADDWVSGPTTPGPDKVKDFGFEATHDPGVSRLAADIGDELELGSAGAQIPRILIDEDDNHGDLPTTELRIKTTGSGARSAEDLERLAGAVLREAEGEIVDGHPDRAVKVLEAAFAGGSTSGIAEKLTADHADAMIAIYETYIDDLQGIPVLAVGLDQLFAKNIDSRAAFLLTRLDGVTSVDELLDIAGMPRVDALRYLASLLLQEVITIGS